MPSFLFRMGQKRGKFSRKDRFQQSTESYDSTQALYFSDGYPIVTNVKESNAEPCGSDSELLEQDSIGVYDYNPQQWRVTNEDPLKSLSDLPQLQVSLIYNLQKKYIAGKITKIKGLRSIENGGPGQIKIHVTLLPADKYITKTQYHNVSTSRLDEYFKMKFKKFPKLNDTNIRYRVYGRRLKFGMSTKESCIGEMFIYLTDIAAATGGVTMWKTLLPKGHAKIVTVPE